MIIHKQVEIYLFEVFFCCCCFFIRRQSQKKMWPFKVVCLWVDWEDITAICLAT